jgi:hypothetical protein
MASSYVRFVVVIFFLWTTNDLLNLAMLLPICNNYEHVKVGTYETLKIHQSFSCIKNFQKIKLKKILLKWVEKLLSWHTPKLLGGLTANPKVKTIEGEGVEARSLTHNTLGVKGRVRASRQGLRRLTNNSITHTDLQKPNNKLVSA